MVNKLIRVNFSGRSSAEPQAMPPQPQDYVEAVKWFRLAADQGFAMAQNNLGSMYLDGQGVPQDLTEAYVWYSVADLGGYPDAANDRDSIAGKLTPDQLAEGQKRATELLDKINSKQ